MVIELKQRALIKVHGTDAISFLQSQFTNDITRIHQDKIQINAYCQHQGKIMAILWVFVKNDNFYLSFPEDLKDLILSRLNMFKLMSNVEFEDISREINQYGLIDERYEASYNIKNNLSLVTTKEKLDTKGSKQQWEKACIDNNLPEIYRVTSEQYTPQVLNLDIDEIGVSFTKGCYPGQEVVARMHYLGKPKRRLFRFQTKFKVSIGDSLNTNDSKSMKSSGQVIRVVNEGHVFHFLGVFEINNINDGIYLNNDENKSVKLVHE